MEHDYDGKRLGAPPAGGLVNIITPVVAVRFEVDELTAC
jgi:hypothetical protein